MNQEELQSYFKNECRTSGDSVIKLGNSQLSRENYLQVKKTLESRGGKWKGASVQGFMFLDGNAPAVLASLSEGETGNIKKKFQLFETPDFLADRLVKKVLPISEAFYILEPSAGRGALIRAIQRECPDAEVTAYEINPDCWPALSKLDNVDLHKEDFLTTNPDVFFKIIVANPPFAKNQDIRHFKQMWKWLAEDGRMAVIMSTHWRFASDKLCKEFREFLEHIGAEIEDVASGEFKTSGTDVPTVIVTAKKTKENANY